METEKGEKRLTLKELKNTLPVHVKDKADQTFTFKDWGMKEEEEIAKLKSSNPTMGKFISAVLCKMLETLQGENFSELEEKKKKLIINQSFSANVMYMYLYLRYDQIDDRLALGFRCPYCQSDIKDIVVSLNDLDVDCKHDDYNPITTYKLKKPITLDKGQRLIEVLKLGLTKWDTVERAEYNNNMREFAGMKAALMSGIVGAEGIDGMLNVGEIINKLRKADIEYIHSKLSKHNAGPDIQAEVTCTKCDNKAYQIIDWTYDNFFGVSSLPQM